MLSSFGEFTVLGYLLSALPLHYGVFIPPYFQVFREIFDEDNYHPIQVDSPEEYNRITEVFPYHDRTLEQASFPKRFPFSLMVPKVYRQVKNYVAACLEFSEDLNLRYVLTTNDFKVLWCLDPLFIFKCTLGDKDQHSYNVEHFSC